MKDNYNCQDEEEEAAVEVIEDVIVRIKRIIS